MTFNSTAFALFFFVVLTGYFWLHDNGARKAWLLLASFVFYAWWDWRFLGLLTFVILTGHYGAACINRSLDKNDRPRARIFLAVSITLQLLVLAFFKYFNFFTDNFTALCASVHWSVSPVTLRVLLPVGISFFTFHAISLTVDVYRRELVFNQSLTDTALYLAFFPQLVAGPIVRAKHFLPQLIDKRLVEGEDLIVGLGAVAAGFVYKVVFADSIAPSVNQIFSTITLRSWNELLFGALGFYAQIYFDFNGYSLIAIGVARLFGYRLRDNFDFPYSSTSLSEFWQRWHISLSSWLRDYLYIPLGGNRFGRTKQFRNLLITMLLGGLWHGASWNFLLWGALHGIGLSVNRAWEISRPTQDPAQVAGSWQSQIGKLNAWFWTQLFVLFCWIPFRADSFAATHDFFVRLMTFSKNAGRPHLSLPWELVLLSLLIDTVVVQAIRKARRSCPISPEAAFAGLTLCFFALWLFVRRSPQPFIYFQF
jgi:alginate O-acetyltransferase complex protein AlgI